MTHSLLPHAPALDEPLEMLEACHERIEAQLKTLERLAAYLPDHGADVQARQAASAILRYFELAGPNHHEDEERDLFPLLAQRAPDSQPLLTEIAIEHITLEGMWSRLREQLLAVNAGEAQALDVHLSQAFVQRYRAHIDHEEHQLLPLAHQLLSADELEQIGGTMSARRRD